MMSFVGFRNLIRRRIKVCIVVVFIFFINLGLRKRVNYLDIICFTGPKLVHSLTYTNEQITNQLYYILKLWEQCRFSQLDDYLFIVGNPDLQLVKLLQQYIKNIEQQNIPSEIFLWNEDAQKAPLDLLTLSL